MVVRAVRILGGVLLATVALQAPLRAQTLTLSLFERYLEALRAQSGIPGLSAVILQGRQIIWERGLGMQDVENSVHATPDTPYPIADLTQALSATLVLRCAEEGALTLDQPVRTWMPSFPDGAATLAQVLSHTSAGSGFQYDLPRFAGLTGAVAGCGADDFRTIVAEDIFNRAAMTDSVPGYDLGDPTVSARALFAPDVLDRYGRVLARVAVPYKVDRSTGKASRSQWPTAGVNAATGLVSTVRDLARFDAALDSHVFVQAPRAAWSNVSAAGRSAPTGLGWFVQSYNGVPVVWQFGMWPDACSSMIVKVPDRELTLILLANSDGLGAGFSLENGDVTTSLFARLFLKLFVV